MRPGFLQILLAAALVVGASSLAPRGAPAGDSPAVLAVIVNTKNPTTNLSLDELRSYFKLERKSWPDKESCEVFLRPSKSPEMEVLLDRVYRMTSNELRKYWVGKIFRGEISAKPAVVPTARAAHARVQKVKGAVAVVLADESMEGVRVLRIDGRKPGDPGYPLVGREEPDRLQGP